ncbi:hypothetical protein SAMN05216368_11150 [Cryobacterium flavum]|uniref:Uncharacterized protein n=1 Tax=Cryobacterium flavum TaxID=1424659 RepID=A0A5E9G1I4_9MICO|nr:hypothetical protein SAMN05216368_11150 [Cryobacterium flavum]
MLLAATTVRNTRTALCGLPARCARRDRGAVPARNCFTTTLSNGAAA